MEQLFTIKKIREIKNEFSRIINDKLPESFNELINSLKKKKFYNLKSNVATRQVFCQRFVIENITKNLPELDWGFGRFKRFEQY